MLENLRQKSGSLIIWVLFGLIIAAFVLFFGPQAGPDMFGCSGGGGGYAVRVKGEGVSPNSWRFAMNGLQFVSRYGQGETRRIASLDFLIEREILAQQAAEQGFEVSDEVANKSIASGTFYIMGRRLDGTQVYFRDGFFDYELFERFVRGSLGLPSVPYAIDEQRRELQAEMMRHFYWSSPLVSEEEARQQYIQSNTTVSARYVKFEPARYRAALELSEADLDAFAASHEAELKKEWEKVEPRWSSDKARVRARHIFVAKGEDADAARAKLEAARQRIVGGAAFGDVASEVSEDERTADRGGSLGWRAADALGYGQELVDAVAGLEVGQVSEIVETPRGFHVAVVEERSDAGLTFEQKKLDLAAQVAPDYYADRLARRAAEQALAKVQGSSLADHFGLAPLPADTPGALPLGVMPPSGAAPDAAAGAETANPDAAETPADTSNKGASPDGAKAPATPAGSGVQDAESTDAPADKPAAPAGGEAATGDKGAFRFTVGPVVKAQGGGSTAAAADDSAEPAAATDEPLPQVDVRPPDLQTIRQATRNGDFLAGVGRSDELVTALFDELAAGQVAAQVYAVSDPDGYVLVELTARQDADMEKFADEVGELRDGMALSKGMELYIDAVQTGCRETVEAGEVYVNNEYLTVETGKPPLPYSPCSLLGEQTAFEQLMSRRMLGL